MTIAFQNEILPKSCELIGYSWLINNFKLEVPLRQLSCISKKRLAAQTIKNGKWLIFDAQLMVEDNTYSHLEFAIKHEDIDLLVLKQILKQISIEEISQNIKINPKVCIIVTNIKDYSYMKIDGVVRYYESGEYFDYVKNLP